MPIDRFHRQIAELTLRAASPHGFALAGGNALMAHGLVDRRTQDVDLFTNEEGGVEAAAQVVEAALQAAGLDAERHDKTGGIADLFPGMGEGLAEWSVRAPDGRATVLQLAYFSRCRALVLMDVGPVLDIEDVVGGKVSPLASRAEPRDYVDTAAALGRYTVDQLIGFSRRLDSGLEQRDFADAGLQLDKWSDDVFASYGLTPAEVAEIRRRFAAWPRSYR